MIEINLKDQRSLSIIGHLIVSNTQVHNYQVRYVKDLFEKNNFMDRYSDISNIFSDSVNLIKKEDSIRLFNNEKTSNREKLFYHLLIIANLDGVIDEDEKNFLKELKINEKVKKDACDKAYVRYKEIVKGYQLFDQDKRDILDFSLGKEIRKIAGYINRIRNIFKACSFDTKDLIELENQGMGGVHKRLLEISKEDFEILQGIYKKLNDETNEILRGIDEFHNNINRKKYDKKTVNNLFDVGKGLSVAVKKQLEDINQELLKKERAINYFTVSFLGKTKAGKSTLHTILTGEDQGAIGDGKQRTTRYNRVYQWGNLRFIDTPGIEAAEVEGRKDEKIAYGIISESDVVCIMVSDDNISENTIALAEKIAKCNKPVIILINHKENLKESVRYKMFLKQPFNWMNKNNRDFYGHIEKIKRDAKNKGFDDMLTIYPVFLLPALLALEKEEDREMLIKSSNIENFKEGMKKQIEKVGTLLRSQTLLDHSREIIWEVKENIDKDIEGMNKFIKDLVKNKEIIEKQFEKEKKNVLSEIESILNNYYYKMENEYALNFATRYYDYKAPRRYWEEYLKENEVNEILESNVNYEINRFVRKLKTIIEDQNNDLEIGLDFNMTVHGAGTNLFDFKKAVQIMGGVIGLGGTIAGFLGIITGPIGWAATGIGVVVSLISRFFKSKARKRQEAIDKLYGNLVSNIYKVKNKNIEKGIRDLENSITENFVIIYGNYDNLIINMKQFKEKTEQVSNKYEKALKKLDFYYSCRILNFLIEEKANIEDAKNIVVDIEREHGEKIFIKTKCNYNYENVKIESIKEIINVKGA